MSLPKTPPAERPPPVAALVGTLVAARNPGAMAAALDGAARPTSSKALRAELKAHIETLAGHLEAERRVDAIATTLAILFVDADYVIPRLRRAGVLRASKYGYKGHLIGQIAKAALSIRSLMNAAPARIDYFDSILALSKLAANARSLQDEIVRIITARKEYVLKTILAVVNTQFYVKWMADPTRSSVDPRRHSSEEFSEAVSLIVSTYATIFPIDDATFNFFDPGVLGQDASIYDRLLVAAIRLTKFRDAETMVDGLPYRAAIAGETVTISSIAPDIERSVRLGYIQGQNQAMIRFLHLSESDPPPSMRDLINMGFENGAFEKLVELAEEPVRRFRLMIPAVPEVFGMFSGDSMLRDEVENLLLLDVDNFGKLDDMIFDISERVSTIDIFKMQRFFNFLSCIYQKKLESVEDAADRLYLTFASTILVVRHEDMIEQMKLIFADEEKCRELVAMFAVRPSGEHLDLQYRPLIDTGNYYVVAPHLFAVSNLVRNTVVANRLRAAAIGTEDRMPKSVFDTLTAAGFKVEAGVELGAAGKRFELDIVAWKDGALFFFECKNAYLPCSVHEMRNSYDHIKVGRDQLTARRETFTEAANQKLLFEKLGWDVPPTAEVHTCIVIANRVFHGSTVGGHPVRQAHELINVLRSGKIGGPGTDLSFWAGPTFQTADLITYLTGDSVTAKQLAALDPSAWDYAMGYRNLVFSSYVMDPDKLSAIMIESYAGLGTGGFPSPSTAD